MEGTLARELADIKRRLTILERPTDTQKMQTTQRAIEARQAADKALTDIATERQRNDTQWKSIDQAVKDIATERQRNDTQWKSIDQAVKDIATERGRNDSQWKSIDSLRNRVDGLSGSVNGAATSEQVRKLSAQIAALRGWAVTIVALLNGGHVGKYPQPPRIDPT